MWLSQKIIGHPSIVAERVIEVSNAREQNVPRNLPCGIPRSDGRVLELEQFAVTRHPPHLCK